MFTEYLTPEQVAQRLQVTERTVYSWLRSGRINAFKLGRLWRITEKDLETFLLAQTVPVLPPCESEVIKNQSATAGEMRSNSLSSPSQSQTNKALNKLNPQNSQKKKKRKR